MLGIVLTDNKLEEITTADLEIEGSSDVEESANCQGLVDRHDPWDVTLGRCANLAERRKIVNEGISLKKRRSAEADSGRYPTIDPKEVKTHRRFKGLLGIDEDLEECISADMAVEGYKLSKPIVLATWPGQEEPVLIDGHTRLKSAKRSGIKKIPYAIERFDDIDGALQYVASVQTKRRPTDDWVLYRLISELDSLMDRGGDRRSDEAKSKRSTDPVETQYKNSALRTAALVGTSDTTVKRARRIRKEGKPDILEALKNRKMTISQAARAIAKKGQCNEAKTPVTQNQEGMVQLTDENLAALKELSGTRHEHVNEAVKQYIANRGWENPIEPEEAESDDQKPRLIQ
jgi:ParB-like chromosome segregation protein Spo0J